MNLYAIGDLHVDHAANRRVVEELPTRPGDWLALVGDVGHSAEHLRWTLALLRPRWSRVLWVPGNHELWHMPGDFDAGEKRYRRLVDVCRSFDVLTPEDPYPVCKLEGEPIALAPLFVLYDYSFRPRGQSKQAALASARRAGAMAVDEALLRPDPYPSREAWCHARVELTEERLGELPAGLRTVLISHFPLRRDVVTLPRIPEFAPWCGTTRTEDWHLRYRAAAVVSAHLHMPRVEWRDQVPFSEVSLGYPREWGRRAAHPAGPQRILPAPRQVVAQ